MARHKLETPGAESAGTVLNGGAPRNPHWPGFVQIACFVGFCLGSWGILIGLFVLIY